MSTTRSIYTSTAKTFVVTKKHVKNGKTLLTNVLFLEIEQYLQNIISKYEAFINTNPKLYKIQMLKNAYLNDCLQLNAQVKKLNHLELHIQITAAQKKQKPKTICKATYKFPIEKELPKAS
ncbi:MAG TPA: hypothetical protein VJ970_02980 [Flavobacteriaceae bacterium]|nr:hypothetical protein [Flavobacteriaceae bacterium]